MSRDGSVVLTFLDGEEYCFRLAWGQLIKLQEARNVGPFVVLERLHGNDWMMEDIRDVIRQGFVGGGMDEVKARKLVKEYVEQRTPLDSLPLARDIIAAGVIGPPDEEPIPKKKEMMTVPTTSPTEGSGSPLSSGSAH